MGNATEVWKSLWRDAPGQRFTRRYERLHAAGRNRSGRLWRWAVGIVLVILGIIWMPLPGPGFVLVSLGLALLAGESSRVARTLDRAELRVRGWMRR